MRSSSGPVKTISGGTMLLGALALSMRSSSSPKNRVLKCSALTTTSMRSRSASITW
jgi:hypothetical protein